MCGGSLCCSFNMHFITLQFVSPSGTVRVTITNNPCSCSLRKASPCQTVWARKGVHPRRMRWCQQGQISNKLNLVLCWNICPTVRRVNQTRLLELFHSSKWCKMFEENTLEFSSLWLSMIICTFFDYIGNLKICMTRKAEWIFLKSGGCWDFEAGVKARMVASI